MYVALHSVGHRFGRDPLLFSGLSERLSPGGIIALTGPSGSGKSTLLSLIAGWIQPDQGSIEKEGCERTHWVFQNPYGVARRTALDHVATPLLASGHSRQSARAHAADIMESFGLGPHANKPFAELSGGQGQRLMLCRAIAFDPDLLLVDEPTAQLDLESASSVIETLQQLAADSRIVVIATHDARVHAVATDAIELRP